VPTALPGLRVLDLTDELGAYATKVLVDLGAEAVVVEPPGGCRLRGLGRRPGLEFAYYRASQRGVTLDVGRPEAVPLLAELAARADVIVVSPSTRAPVAGFDDETWPAWAPVDRIVAAVTPFGRTGPYRRWRATNLTVSAMGGGMLRYGPVEGPPVAMPGRQANDETGLHAAATILAALENRPVVGGQLLDVAVHEVLAAKDDLIHRYGTSGTILGREERPGLPPAGTWECRDGTINIGAFLPRHWDAFLETMDRPDILSESSLEDRMVRLQLWESLTEIITGLMATRSAHEVVTRGQANGLPCAVLNTPGEFLADPQAACRGYWRSVAAGGVTACVPGDAFVAARMFRAAADRSPAPALGEHNDDVYLGALGHDRAELAQWVDDGLV
jgi:crotonobetainyl-CoA:carnitine CoA-transferase CaiB-like acyl-CoA transferase